MPMFQVHKTITVIQGEWYNVEAPDADAALALVQDGDLEPDDSSEKVAHTEYDVEESDDAEETDPYEFGLRDME